MNNLFLQGASKGWVPDSDDLNAEEGVLLRATNIVRDELGALVKRKGSATLYSGLTGGVQDTGVHSLYETTLPSLTDPNGIKVIAAGSGDQLYLNGAAAGTFAFGGSGDIAMGDDSYSMFFAREKTKKKWDGVTLYNWDIGAPSKAATVSASSVIQTVFQTFANSGDTAIPAGATAAISVVEGTGAYIAGHDGSASAAIQITPVSATGRASIQKIFSTDQNLFDILSVPGGDTDLIDVYVQMANPRKFNGLRIDIGLDNFGAGTAGDPFKNDRYTFTFEFSGATEVDIKSPPAYSASSFATAAGVSQVATSPADVTHQRTADQVKVVLGQVGAGSGQVSAPRGDVAWAHFTVTRGQFQRIGGTSGRNWKTVRGIQFVYTCVPGDTTATISLDQFSVIGGGNRALTGEYSVAYRFVYYNGVYNALSPVSPLSDKITLNQQALSITFDANTLSAADAQVNQIWVYLFGGFLDRYYRVATLSSQASGHLWSTDEFTAYADGSPNPIGTPTLTDKDTSDLRLGMGMELGGVFPPDFNASANNVTLTLKRSELDILTENIPLEPGAIGIPDDIIAIAGPWHNRMFLVTSEGYIYPTTQTSPANCCVFHAMDCRRYGDPLWAVRTVSGVYVGFTKDIVLIGGTGNESPDGSIADLFAHPLNVGNPPVGGAVYTNGSTVLYQSADGPMSLTGNSLSPLPKGGTSLLWRNYDRWGVNHVNLLTGRFRMVVDNQIAYFLMSEGEETQPNAVWRLNLTTGEWTRTTYPYTLLSIWRTIDGRVIAGGLNGTDGVVVQLETGEQDNRSNVAIDILYPWQECNEPLKRKVPFDTLVHMDTGGDTCSMYLVRDDADPHLFQIIAPGEGHYRMNASWMEAFFHMQIQFTGSFRTFRLQEFNLSYRLLAQHMMYVDTDYIIPPGDSDLVWLQELEVDVISPVDLIATVYIDDDVFTTQPVTVRANKRSVYLVPLPRACKGRRVRVSLATTNDNGVGPLGFECFRIRYRHQGSGNMFEIPFQTVSPSGAAN